jgi:hypothetical protein
LYRGINDFKNSYQPRTTCVMGPGIQTASCLLVTSTYFVTSISHMIITSFIYKFCSWTFHF